MALRLEIEQLRERLKRMTRPGMAIIAVSLTLLVAGLVYVGWKLSNNVPPSAPAPGAKSVASVSAFCRPCADLSRLETAMQASLAHAGSGGIEAADKTRIVDAIKGWHRRCSTLLCETKTGQAQACSAPPAALLSELAAIDHLSDSLSARTAQCSISGCQTAKCEPAQTAANAFGTLQQELHGLVDHPEGLASERHDVATGFVFDEISNLTDTVLSTPQLVAQGRYAAAEARLLFLRDAALSAGANVPDSAESVLADRMDDLTHSIDALAKAERVGLTGPALAGLWQDFAEASSRLMVETAGLSVRMPARSSAFASLVAPPAASAAEASAAPVCNGALRLVEASATHLNDAMGQLAMCNVRAECHLDDDATSSIQRPANAGSALEILASERQAATDALSALAYAREQDVDLKTDLAQYWAHEAIQVTPLSDTNRCLMDRGSRLVLGSEGANGDVTPVEAHPLDPSDNAAWLFEAPKPPGRYRFVLLAPKTRGCRRLRRQPILRCRRRAHGLQRLCRNVANGLRIVDRQCARRRRPRQLPPGRRRPRRHSRSDHRRTDPRRPLVFGAGHRRHAPDIIRGRTILQRHLEPDDRAHRRRREVGRALHQPVLGRARAGRIDGERATRGGRAGALD